MSYDPFTSNQDFDRMDLSTALNQCSADILNLEEFDMATTQTETKKKTSTATTAPVAAASRKKVSASPEVTKATKASKPAATKPEATKGKPEVKAAATKPAKTEPTGDFVTVADLATEFKITPAVARRVLRAKIAKGDEGFRWAWKAGSKELAAAKAALTK